MASISTIRFGNFSIREYVATIRETEPERLALVPDNNVLHGNKDPEASELEGLKQHETGPGVASEIIIITDSDDDTSRTIAEPRAQLTIELRNDSDDVTLKSPRKRKAAHPKLNKKQKPLKAKEPKLDESETSSHGPKGLNSHAHFATRKLQEAECSGSGACNGLGGSEPSGSGSVVGQRVAAAGALKGLTGPEVDVGRTVDREVLVCSLNQNPSDFIMSFESGCFRK